MNSSKHLFHHLLKPSKPPFLHRHITTQSQLDQTNNPITQIKQLLLQTPETEWTPHNQTLTQLLSPTPPLTPSHLFQITHSLSTSSKALTFFTFLQTHSPKNTTFHSFSFQAVLELVSREPNSPKTLLHLYEKSKEWNVQLTLNSVTLLAKNFKKAGMVNEVINMCNELDNACVKDVYVRNVVIDCLFRIGSFYEACQVVREMLELEGEFAVNKVTMDLFFDWILREDECWRMLGDEGVVKFVREFGEQKVFLNCVKLTKFITVLCRRGKVEMAWEVLSEVMDLGGGVEAASCNALLATLGREGKFGEIGVVLGKMKESDVQPNVVTFGICINHLCKFRRVDEALEVFEKMRSGESESVEVEPDVILYNTLIDGLCKVGRLDEGFGLMEKMRLQKGCAPNTVTYNCLIDGLCKAGEIGRARELFDQMNKEGVLPNVITVNTLVDSMCKHGRISGAVQFFNEMQEKGLKGNVVTYTSLITAFCNANNIDKAKELFDEMLNGGCSPDAIVYYALISGFCQAGRMDDASAVASKLTEAGFHLDNVSYNMLISGFCKKNKLDKAYGMLKKMEKAGVRPSDITYNILISYFSKTGDFKSAHEVLKKMQIDGLVPNVITYGALIHAYCESGNLDEAMKIFRDMSLASRIPPNTIIYNILIDSLCKSNDIETALFLIDDMRDKGVRPNITTYNAMFKGLQEKNWVEKAFELMNRMTEEACDPNYITMEILTEWLSAVGETEKLQNFVQGYPVSASVG